jgi:phosphohistidine phosphatase
MNIHLLRHGIAAPLGSENQYQDQLRELTPDGMSKMRKAAQGLKRLGVTFDLIASSPLVRARQTAEIVSEIFKFREPVTFWQELEPEGSIDGFLQKLKELQNKSSALVVGHQPSIGCLASYLLCGNPEISLPFKKGAIFSIQLSELPPQSAGQLLWMLTSKLMRRVAEL